MIGKIEKEMMMMIDSWMVIGRFVSCFSDFFTNLPFFSTKIIIYFMVRRVVTFFKSSMKWETSYFIEKFVMVFPGMTYLFYNIPWNVLYPSTY